MGIENRSRIACGIGFVVEKFMPRMATKQSSSMLLSPFLDDLDDAQAGTLQAAIRRMEEWKNGKRKHGSTKERKNGRTDPCG